MRESSPKNNLWKMDLSKRARLIYTILSEAGRSILIVLEAFLNYDEYGGKVRV